MLKIRTPVQRLLIPPEVIAQPGGLAFLRLLPASRIAVVCSPSVFRDETTKNKLRKTFLDLNHEIIELPGGEPVLESMTPLLHRLESFSPDWLVAIGGGAALDSAKGLWALYEHPEFPLERLGTPFALPRLRGKARFAAVPTTVGTGSEVSSAAIIGVKDGDGGKKVVQVVSHDFIPDLVVLDPELLGGLPTGVLVSSALDTLAHAVEGSVSRVPNQIMEASAQLAVNLIFENFDTALQATPRDLKALLNLQLAAFHAGLVQNARIPGLGHALAHQLQTFGLPHGWACGALLPFSMSFNARQDAVKDRYRKLLGAFTGGTDPILFLQRKIDAWMAADPAAAERRHLWDKTLDSHLDQICEEAQKDICWRMNPVPATVDEVKMALASYRETGVQ